MFIIDIGVPRDVEPAVNRIEGVYLYDIDALESLAEDGRRRREDQVAACDRIIGEHLEAAAWGSDKSARASRRQDSRGSGKARRTGVDKDWKPAAPA